MRKLPFITVLTLATVLFATHSHAQGAIYAPLSLFTTGSGSITPLQDGQSLEVGQDYEMTGIPDSGYVFSSWQPVNIFTITTFVNDEYGNTFSNVDVFPSLQPEYSENPVLDFTMQPVTVVLDIPGQQEITSSLGWQANFLPVPEPSCFSLIMCGLMLVVFFKAWGFNKLAILPNKLLSQPPLIRSLAAFQLVFKLKRD